MVQQHHQQQQASQQRQRSQQPQKQEQEQEQEQEQQQQQQQQQQLAVRRNTQDTPWNVSTCGQKRHTSLAWASHLFIMIFSAWQLAVRKDTFEHFHFLMSYKFSTSARPKVLWTPQVLKILTSKCAFRHSRVHFFNMYKTFSLPNVLFASAACKFSTSARPKVLRTPHVLKILTSKCAFRHSRVHFFNISTYKSGPNTSCFVHFDFKMHVSPQWRTIFRHLNFEKCSRTLSFLTFSLPNVLFATVAYNFSTSALTKVLSECGVLYIFTSECAFRHSGVQFLIYPLTTWLRTRRFNRPTFRLTRHTNHWKNTAFRDFSNI